MHYTPILKDRPAELKAMTLLHTPRVIALEMLWPLIEVRVPDDEAGLKDILDKINRDLTASPCARFMIDLNAVDSTYPTAQVSALPSTYSPLEYLSVKSVSHWQLTPVVTLSSSATLLTTSVATARTHNSNIAIRLIFDDLQDVNFATNLDALVLALGLPREELHIILDACAITPSNVTAIQMALVGSIAGFPHVSDWASITVAASAFPAATPPNPPGAGSIARIPRTEWDLYQRLRSRFTALDISFGDYGIDNPEFAPNPNARSVSNLRYTASTEWLFVKGRLVSKGGADYFRDVCRIIAAQPEYMSPTYSWGDEFIDTCGGGGGGTGNAVTWRQVAVTHHITLVLDQLSGLGAGAAATTPAF